MEKPACILELLAYLDSCRSPVCMETLGGLLKQLEVSREDLDGYCNFGEVSYRRNLVSRTEWYELFVLCWKPGQASPIHDHHGSSCAFKIIEGRATEMICEQTGEREGRLFVKPVNSLRYERGQVCVSQSADIHEVGNRASTDDLITMHIYSPPLNMRTYRLDPSPETLCAGPIGEPAS